MKQAAVKGYKGQVHLSAPTLQAREELTNKIIDQTGATMLHPSNNPWVIAGKYNLNLYKNIIIFYNS